MQDVICLKKLICQNSSGQKKLISVLLHEIESFVTSNFRKLSRITANKVFCQYICLTFKDFFARSCIRGQCLPFLRDFLNFPPDYKNFHVAMLKRYKGFWDSTQSCSHVPNWHQQTAAFISTILIPWPGILHILFTDWKK